MIFCFRIIQERSEWMDLAVGLNLSGQKCQHWRSKQYFSKRINFYKVDSNFKNTNQANGSIYVENGRHGSLAQCSNSFLFTQLTEPKVSRNPSKAACWVAQLLFLRWISPRVRDLHLQSIPILKWSYSINWPSPLAQSSEFFSSGHDDISL